MGDEVPRSRSGRPPNNMKNARMSFDIRAFFMLLSLSPDLLRKYSSPITSPPLSSHGNSEAFAPSRR